MSLGDQNLCRKLAALWIQDFFFVKLLALWIKQLWNQSKKRAVVDDTLGCDYQKTGGHFFIFFQKATGIHVFVKQQWFYHFVTSSNSTKMREILSSVSFKLSRFLWLSLKACEGMHSKTDSSPQCLKACWSTKPLSLISLWSCLEWLGDDWA